MASFLFVSTPAEPCLICATRGESESPQGDATLFLCADGVSFTLCSEHTRLLLDE